MGDPGIQNDHYVSARQVLQHVLATLLLAYAHTSSTKRRGLLTASHCANLSLCSPESGFLSSLLPPGVGVLDFFLPPFLKLGEGVLLSLLPMPGDALWVFGDLVLALELGRVRGGTASIEI